MAGSDFSRRSAEKEFMDSPLPRFEEFDDYLNSLEFVNILTLAYRPTLAWFKRVLKHARKDRALTILDIGCGNGDMLRRLWACAGPLRVNLALTGIDINPWSRRAAEPRLPKDASIFLETADVFAMDTSRKADFIISSLFTHHLTDAEVIKFLRWMDAHAAQGWFINDLHRHSLPYYAARLVGRCLSINPMVKHDGPVSVARAFTKNDWCRLLAEAGIPLRQTRVRWFFPFRICVERTIAKS